MNLFNQENGQLVPIVVEAPGGGFNPDFNNVFAQNLGFGPPPPGAQPMPPAAMGGGGYGGPPPGGGYGGPPPGGGYGGPPPAGGYGAPPPQHNVGAGTFDMGGGQHLQVKINGMTPENYVKNQASSMLWGWIIGGVIVLLVIVTFAGIGGYIWWTARDTASELSGAPGAATPGTWDGKSTFVCSGNDVVSLTGVTATAGVQASANCQLILTGVNITAPVAIEASSNAKVTVTGGSLNASTNSVVASGNAKVNLVGTKVTGKQKSSGNAKITGI